MILLVDVFYINDLGYASGIVISDWTDNAPAYAVNTITKDIKSYEPGKFYKRELPCILNLLKELKTDMSHIVIDGYVWLDNNKDGLGAHLYHAIKEQTPVIGVAKNPFSSVVNMKKVFRGSSKKPLYVTAIGEDLQKASECIRNMFGKNRIPDMIKLADMNSKKVTNFSQ